MDILNMRSAGRRNGLSLIEIMVSILVLSIGLLGVLAVIPYGGFQLARMKDADYSSTLAQSAFGTIKTNNWYLPVSSGATNIKDNWSQVQETAYYMGSATPVAVSSGSDSLVVDGSAYNWVANSNVVTASSSLSVAWSRFKASPNTASQFMVKSGDRTYVDLTYPIMIDPVGSLPTSLFRTNKPTMLGDLANNAWHYSPRPYTVTAWSGLASQHLPLYRMMWPTYSYDDYTTFLVPSGVKYFFYSHDDITYGLSDVERGGDFRPRLQREESGTVLNNSRHDIDLFYDELYPYVYVPRRVGNVVQSGYRGNLELSVPTTAENVGYTGQYSWMAMLQLYPTTDPFCDCLVSDIQKADVDVVVFKGRSKDSYRNLPELATGNSVDTPVYDTITCDAQLRTNGTYGGMFYLYPQLTSGMTMGDVLERLGKTSHILLIGDEDTPINYNGFWVYRKFARWYKVAYFKSDKDSDGNTWIVANLSGPSCPEKWSMLYNYDNVPDYWMGKLSESDNVLNEAHYRIQRTTVKAVIFPHVVDVYSRTFTVSN